ncbi:MAG: hypothetical protein ACLFVU_14190, partial [Phycisphaerae bacterium]
MDIFQSIRNLLGGRKTLAKLTVDELRRERVRLEQLERQLCEDIESLESRKKALFDKGVSEASPRQQASLARRIKQMAGEIRVKDRSLQMVGKQLGVLGGLTALKENESLVEQMGLTGLIGQMDLAQLQRYVEKATVKGEFQMERFAEMLQVVDAAGDLIGGDEEDEGVLEIVAAMQEAAGAEKD